MLTESACENLTVPRHSVMFAVVGLALAVEAILVGVVGLVA